MANEDFPFLSYAASKAMEHRVNTKCLQALLGICTGIIADEAINDKEISYIRTWLLEHESLCDQWPASAIHYKIAEIMEDGIITTEERDALMTRLQQLTGNYFAETGAAQTEGPAMPIDDDPSIYFRNMSFCFTGEFMYGTRAACERAILKLGALPVDRVTKKIDYLVIGSMVNPNWVNETYGRKIEQAMKYKEDGCELTIISERQWSDALIEACSVAHV